MSQCSITEMFIGDSVSVFILKSVFLVLLNIGVVVCMFLFVFCFSFLCLFWVGCFFLDFQI